MGFIVKSKKKKKPEILLQLKKNELKTNWMWLVLIWKELWAFIYSFSFVRTERQTSSCEMWTCTTLVIPVLQNQNFILKWEIFKIIPFLLNFYSNRQTLAFLHTVVKFMSISFNLQCFQAGSSWVNSVLLTESPCILFFTFHHHTDTLILAGMAGQIWASAKR